MAVSSSVSKMRRSHSSRSPVRLSRRCETSSRMSAAVVSSVGLLSLETVWRSVMALILIERHGATCIPERRPWFLAGHAPVPRPAGSCNQEFPASVEAPLPCSATEPQDIARTGSCCGLQLQPVSGRPTNFNATLAGDVRRARGDDELYTRCARRGSVGVSRAAIPLGTDRAWQRPDAIVRAPPTRVREQTRHENTAMPRGQIGVLTRHVVDCTFDTPAG